MAKKKKTESVSQKSTSPKIEEAVVPQRQDVLQLLQTVLKLAVEMMNADRGVILEIENKKFKEVASHNFPPDTDEALEDVSMSVVNQVVESGDSLLTHDAQADPRFGQAASVILHQITSIICAPMFFEEHIIGVIYLDSRKNRQFFTEENLNFINTFARMAAIAIDYAVGYEEVYSERQRLQDEVQERWKFDEIIGNSPKMQEVFGLMQRVLNSDISVLLEGESGTGKELVARALHYSGHRRDKPFVAQFCGNLAESLLESELFGHKKGSFTGAVADKKGLFEIADDGTFFLDEIADISPTIQSKLLRVIQEGEIRRVGDTDARKVDVRLISATNKSLKTEVASGEFREDLYYRLNVITIKLPPLRERVGDVQLLVRKFLDHFAAKNQMPVKKITPRAMNKLVNYNWPGNVRELENTIERAMILSENDMIDVKDLFINEEDEPTSGVRTLKEHEKEFVMKTLAEFGDNKTRTAEALGVSLRWLHYKLNEWKKSTE